MRERHPLVASCICPDWTLNPQLLVHGTISNLLSYLVRAYLDLLNKNKLLLYLSHCTFLECTYSHSLAYTNISFSLLIIKGQLSSRITIHEEAYGNF